MFDNKRYITKGVNEKVSFLLQLFMWQCIDSMDVQKDYLQVFKLSVENRKQKIEHIQEEPCYRREYLFYADTPVLICKIFVIDDGSHSTMLLAEEY